MLTLRDLLEMVGGIQATLDMAGAWEANRRELAPFQVRRSEMRFGPPGIEKVRIVDCTGAAWLAKYKQLHVDLRKVVFTEYTIGVYAPESSDAFEVLLLHDFFRWIEHFVLLSRTKTGVSLSFGYRRPEPVDLDESFVAVVERAQVERPIEEQLDAKISRLLEHFHGDGASTVLHVATSDEERRKSFRIAHQRIERRLGAAARTVLQPSGRLVWWRRGTGAVALWEEGPGPYFELHVSCWREDKPKTFAGRIY